MQEYVYILSNPSMPGLVKVGKTTTSPQQRMMELHSTGVPTAFLLEFCVEVKDCHSAERSAHRALAGNRLANNREFFRIPVRDAVAKVLPHLGSYTLVHVNETHGISKLEQKLRRRREQEQFEREQTELAARAMARRLEREKAVLVQPLLHTYQRAESQLAQFGSPSVPSSRQLGEWKARRAEYWLDVGTASGAEARRSGVGTVDVRRDLATVPKQLAETFASSDPVHVAPIPAAVH